MKEDEFVKKILRDIESVKNKFSDIGNRKIFFFHLKNDIDTLWDLVPEDGYSKNLVMVLMDGIKNIKADNINCDQLDAIKDVVETISKGNVTEEELDFHIEFLIKKDISLIRLPGNISDLYD